MHSIRWRLGFDGGMERDGMGWDGMGKNVHHVQKGMGRVSVAADCTGWDRTGLCWVLV